MRPPERYLSVDHSKCINWVIYCKSHTDTLNIVSIHFDQWSWQSQTNVTLWMLCISIYVYTFYACTNIFNKKSTINRCIKYFNTFHILARLIMLLVNERKIDARQKSNRKNKKLKERIRRKKKRGKKVNKQLECD